MRHLPRPHHHPTAAPIAGRGLISGAGGQRPTQSVVKNVDEQPRADRPAEGVLQFRVGEPSRGPPEPRSSPVIAGQAVPARRNPGARTRHASGTCRKERCLRHMLAAYSTTATRARASINGMDGLDSAGVHVKRERRWAEVEEKKRTQPWARRNHRPNNICTAYLMLGGGHERCIKRSNWRLEGPSHHPIGPAQGENSSVVACCAHRMHQRWRCWTHSEDSLSSSRVACQTQEDALDTAGLNHRDPPLIHAEATPGASPQWISTAGTAHRRFT